MILCDTSAWVDHFRGRRTRAAERVLELFGSGDVVTTDAVVLEVLAGARDERHLLVLERTLGSFERIAVESFDFEAGASIFRACRRRGAAPRSLVDCLIAAVALRVGASILHNDRDFDVIARHVGLTIDRP